MKYAQAVGFVIILIFSHLAGFSQKNVRVYGTISELSGKELLIGANVFIPALKTGAVSNNYGFYSVSVPKGDSVLVLFSYVGFQREVKMLYLKSDTLLDVGLKPLILKEVTISANSPERQLSIPVTGHLQIGNEKLSNTPGLFGERDAYRILQLVPGVGVNSEFNSGLCIRGSNYDQNLVLLDDATVYNTNHFFGYFSTFNGDAIKNIDLYKGAFPARYGGRNSAVIDISMRDGDKENYHVNLGIGLVSAKLTAEGPIVKNHSSFLVAFRRTYLGFLATKLYDDVADYPKYHFYDLNTKINTDLGKNDRLYLSLFTSSDKFSSTDGSSVYTMNWSNLTSTLRWNHVYSSSLFSNLSLIYSEYKFRNLIKEGDSTNLYKAEYLSEIRNYSVKYDLDYIPSNILTIKAGLTTSIQDFKPGAVAIHGVYDTARNLNQINTYRATEAAAYTEGILHPWKNFQFNLGFRMNIFQTKNNQYLSPEPRISASYLINEKNSFKLSWSLNSQMIHLLTNTAIGLPTDLWVHATDSIPPQKSMHFVAGYYSSLWNNSINLSIEAYYKELYHIIGYKPGASFVTMSADASKNSFPDWEKNVTSGKGRAYGLEIFMEKKTGRLNAWLGYTLSWSKQQFDIINNGREFYSAFDSRHQVNLSSSYLLREKQTGGNGIRLSINWVLATGRPITLPLAQYHVSAYGVWDTRIGTEYYAYNEFRMKTFHRMDVSLQLSKNKKRFERTWEFGIYNLYNRWNASYYYMETDYYSGTSKLYQKSYFPILPYITLNIKL
ncbi:MAG: TonB-dependent receptor [Bacteroidetes bacterium]|nr:TonB-dependent receptor [Bacteroidota bacterium]